MARHRDDFTAEDYDALKAVILDLADAAPGPFAAGDALRAVGRAGLLESIGDVVAILDDLVDLGHLDRLRVEGGWLFRRP